MHRRHPFLNILALTLVLAKASPSHAQGFPFSQRGSVSQTVALTDITVSYGRPVARGRSLFGQLVPWDSVWHPGADSATRITFSHDVRLEGKPVAKGEYSLWVIPRESKPWTVILNRKAHVFHRPYPGSGSDAFRVDVQPESGMHMESLMVYFPVVLRDTAVMRVHWGSTMLSVRIKAPYRPGAASQLGTAKQPLMHGDSLKQSVDEPRRKG
ncbi:MAG: DUF2911 domain-containing protein [Gemmatimonadaceae bacterium]